MRSVFWRTPRFIRSVQRKSRGRTYQILISLVLAVGARAAAGHALPNSSEQATSGAGAGSSQTTRETLPKDIYPDTGNRFPGIKREELDEAGKKLYDTRGVADSFGPGAIRLYSPAVADSMTGVNEYLRRKSGLDRPL